MIKMEKLTLLGLCLILLTSAETEEPVNDYDTTEHISTSEIFTVSATTSSTDDAQPNFFLHPGRMSRQDRILQRQRSRFARLSMIRQQVLDSLGFEEPPQINSTIRRLTLENLSRDPSFFQAFDNTENNCYTASCTLPTYISPSLWAPEGDPSLRLFFNVMTFDESEKTLSSAPLKLHMRQRETCQCGTADGTDIPTRLFITVYQYLRPLRRRRAQRKRIIDVQMVTWEGDAWVTFSVEQAARDWIFGNVRNIGLEVVVKDSNENILNANEIFDPVDCNRSPNIECTSENEVIATENGSTFSAPILETTTVSKPRQFFRRRKRSARSQKKIPTTVVLREQVPDTPVAHTEGCVKQEIKVNFTDANIISPVEISTAVCVGQCPECEGHKKCVKLCRPTKTESMEVSYMQDGRIVHTVVPDLVVAECGCGL